jgi:leucyl/phenylalanyl-tRNA--protein transferase
MSTVNNPLYFIGQGQWEVPNPEDVANDEGLIALSWELNPEMYARLYPYGIFPWFDQDGVVFWFSPPVRSMTPTDQVKIAKSMRSKFNSGNWRFSVNLAFHEVVRKCSSTPRPGQAGTWISEKFQQNFSLMHALGRAHSFEVWENDQLIGGTFGVMTGKVFVGESMFHSVRDASKFAYIGMCQYLHSEGVAWIDNQLPTAHLSSLGALDLPRVEFLSEMGRFSASVNDNVRIGREELFRL